MNKQEEQGANYSLPVLETSHNVESERPGWDQEKRAWDRERMVALVRAAIGPGATSRQVARVVASRSGDEISHTTASALMRGDRVSPPVLSAFATAYGLDLNELREVAGLPAYPVRTDPLGERIVHVADIATLLHDVDAERWACMSEEQRQLALDIALQSLRGLLRGMVPSVRKRKDALCV